jgi:hypothetical protein
MTYKPLKEVKICLNETKVEFFQWFQNGDLPDDDYKNDGVQGKIIRKFRCDDIDTMTICPLCRRFYHDHGFIYASFEWRDIDHMQENKDLEGGQIVCPGNFIIKMTWKNLVHYSVIHKDMMHFITDWEIKED